MSSAHLGATVLDRTPATPHRERDAARAFARRRLAWTRVVAGGSLLVIAACLVLEPAGGALRFTLGPQALVWGGVVLLLASGTALGAQISRRPDQSAAELPTASLRAAQSSGPAEPALRRGAPAAASEFARAPHGRPRPGGRPRGLSLPVSAHRWPLAG